MSARVHRFEESTYAGYRVDSKLVAQIEVVAEWNNEHDIPDGVSEMRVAHDLACAIARAVD